MDNDVWKLPELRSWFQLNAREPTPDAPDPQRAGYMVAGARTAPARANAVAPLRAATAPVFVGKRLPTPGFNDFEGCLRRECPKRTAGFNNAQAAGSGIFMISHHDHQRP